MRLSHLENREQGRCLAKDYLELYSLYPFDVHRLLSQDDFPSDSQVKLAFSDHKEPFGLSSLRAGLLSCNKLSNKSFNKRFNYVISYIL